MLSNLNTIRLIAFNFAIMVIWQFVCLILCKILPIKIFDHKKLIYRIQPWENNGDFYVKFLKIKKWKDCLPQYTSKNGFSKKHINFNKNTDLSYINEFITETCRAEWNHLACCFYFLFAFMVNSLKNAIIFSFIPILANLPFLLIQRYNRARLLKVRAKMEYKVRCF